ncbi:MAG: nucleotidyl transferase AbiEii/AbiGii toxin family protein [bacterium]
MGQTILTQFQKQILEQIKLDPRLTSQFYFTGGTALSAYYFQHRISEDLDFFSEAEFDYNMLLIWLKKLQSTIPLSKIEQQNGNSQVTFFLYHKKNSAPLKLDFAYFPFSHIGKFIKDKNLRISSVEDVTINKIHAISSRTRSRDYLDLMFCLQQLGWTAKDIMKNYRLKFDIILPPESLATSFTNVTEASDLPIFLGKTPWDKVENYFLKLAKSLGPNLISR